MSDEILFETELPTPVRIRAVPVPDGEGRRHLVVDAHHGAGGAVCVVVWSGRVALVRQHRPAVDDDTWELPRGSTEAGDGDPVATARREVGEELGVDASTWPGRTLADVWVDSGLLSTRAHVVELSHPSGEDAPDEHEAPPGEGADGEVTAVRWAPAGALPGLVADGTLRDALSLAALAAWWSTDRR